MSANRMPNEYQVEDDYFEYYTIVATSDTAWILSQWSKLISAHRLRWPLTVLMLCQLYNQFYNMFSVGLDFSKL